MLRNLRSGVESPRLKLEIGDSKPTWRFRGWDEIDVEGFVNAGIEHVLIDLDGCLTPAYEHDQTDLQALMALGRMWGRFESISIATNNERYIEYLRSIYGVDHIFQPWDDERFLQYKPHPEFFERIIRDLGVKDPSTILMIGDDPERDVDGANAMGMQTALIDRLDPYEFF